MKLRKRRHDVATISGFVASPEAAEAAVEVLTASGIPRDLVEVVVRRGLEHLEAGTRSAELVEQRPGSREASRAAREAGSVSVHDDRRAQRSLLSLLPAAKAG